VQQDREPNQQTDVTAYLEAEADRRAVEEALECDACGGERTDYVWAAEDSSSGWARKRVSRSRV
jgi:hypothetical protein